MYKGFLHTHTLVVTLFLLIYVIKTILLLSNKNELLEKFSKKVKVFEMIVSALFLITGVYLATQLPLGGKFDYLFYIKVGMVLAAIPIAIIGFKRSNKILAALSLLLITGSYGIAEVYSKRKAVPKENANQLASNDGKSLYELNCAVCHGNDGKLGLAGAKDISITSMDISAITEIIRNGKGAMPASQVDETQAAVIAQYVNDNLKQK